MSHTKGTHAFASRPGQNAADNEVTAPTHDDIAKCAFDIYVKTGRRQGQCTQNWHQAEDHLRSQGSAACHTGRCSEA
jgi:hypothetical protein